MPKGAAESFQLSGLAASPVYHSLCGSEQRFLLQLEPSAAVFVTLKSCLTFWACVSSLDECRNIILQYGVREVTACQVARVLGMMARTHSGLSDGIPLQVRPASAPAEASTFPPVSLT